MNQGSAGCKNIYLGNGVVRCLLAGVLGCRDETAVCWWHEYRVWDICMLVALVAVQCL